MRVKRGGLLTLVAAAALIAPAGASASTITVTSAADSSGVACTLRDAITAANTDTIFGGCPTGQTSPVVDLIDLSGLTGTITLATPLPAVIQGVNIQGPGASALTISGNNAVQPFSVSGTDVRISGLTIDQGSCPGSCGAEGGAIFNNGGLTLDGVTITGSTASGLSGGANSFAEGGAIENRTGASLDVLNSTISGNSVIASGGTSQNGASGGAIMNRGSLNLTRSTVSNNLAKGTAAGGATANVGGGAVSNNGQITIVRSTLSDNKAMSAGAGPGSAIGGAISQFNNTATSLDIEASTIANNVASSSAASQGGGVYLIGNQATLSSSTFTGNTADLGANLGVAQPPSITNSIITNPQSGQNCFGAAVISGGFNIESANSCGLGAASDQTAISPMLGPLADNGGPTQTRAPMSGSPAIDAGKSAVSETTDQRGLLRPSDIFSVANAAGGDGSDIGAVEIQDTVAPDTVIDTGPAEGSVSNDRTPDFSYHSTEGPSSRLECATDGGGGTFTTCSSPKTLGSLTDGDHTFAVRAIDPNQNIDATPATRSFSIDATAPKTKIGHLPRKIKKRSVKVKFSSSEAHSTFKCKLDHKPFKSCKSPLTLKHLKLGKHKIQVKATDAVGNADKTPASKSFKVVRRH